MKVNDIDGIKQAEMTNAAKAGVIPFTIDGGQIKMLFMVPSDPMYGGPKPQIAKGGIDPGESAYSTAWREGEEELGLIRSNVVDWFKVVGPVEIDQYLKYSMEIYACRVTDPNHFDSPHYETGAVYWLTLDEYIKYGRVVQAQLVKQTVEKIKTLYEL